MKSIYSCLLILFISCNSNPIISPTKKDYSELIVIYDCQDDIIYTDSIPFKNDFNPFKITLSSTVQPASLSFNFNQKIDSAYYSNATSTIISNDSVTFQSYELYNDCSLNDYITFSIFTIK